MDRKSFEILVLDALEELPEDFRARLKNIDFVVEDEPPPWLLDSMGIRKGGSLLGLYQGVPLSGRGHYYGNVLPDRVVIYMGPILRDAGSAGSLRSLVREVVLHEVGHFFGLSEDELRRLEGRGSS